MPGRSPPDDAMANLLPRNKPISRGRLFASDPCEPQQEADVYNNSSLALDPETSAPHKHTTGSHVVEWPHPVAAIAPDGAAVPWKTVFAGAAGAELHAAASEASAASMTILKPVRLVEWVLT